MLVLTARVRAVLEPLAIEPLEVQDDDTKTGVVASLHFEPDSGPHEVRAEAWGDDTVRLTFTVDTATAARLARAYDGASAAGGIDMEARTGTALPWRAVDALIHALPYPALADLVDGNGIFVARGLLRDHAQAIAEAVNARHSAAAPIES